MAAGLREGFSWSNEIRQLEFTCLERESLYDHVAVGIATTVWRGAGQAAPGETLVSSCFAWQVAQGTSRCRWSLQVLKVMQDFFLML